MAVLLDQRQFAAMLPDPERLTLSDDDVLPEVSFAHVLLDMTARARRREDLVGVVSLRIDIDGGCKRGRCHPSRREGECKCAWEKPENIRCHCDHLEIVGA